MALWLPLANKQFFKQKPEELNSAELLMLKKRDRAFECYPYRVGAANAAHPSPAHMEKLLKRTKPFPVRTKQIKRQNKPLITTFLCRF
jgi:hypothetical protein